MDLAGSRSPHEAAAKAALLNFLRQQELLTDAVVVSELELRSAGRRADLVFIGSVATAIEIKTKADSLARLPSQLDTFCRAFPASYAAVASVHLRKTFALAPKGCGIIELRERHSGIEVRIHRRPKPFVHTTAVEQASLLPARELGKALRALGVRAPSGCRRDELTKLVEGVAPKALSAVVTAYLRSKYVEPSDRFAGATSGRAICQADLRLLRLWEQTARPEQERTKDPDLAFFDWLSAHAGDCPLGEVPVDIAAALAA